MTQELVTIEINDQSYEVPKGSMLIDVADANNIKIPRFCYHKKLSVAANCRMCLVEMEKSFIAFCVFRPLLLWQQAVQLHGH